MIWINVRDPLTLYFLVYGSVWDSLYLCKKDPFFFLVLG